MKKTPEKDVPTGQKKTHAAVTQGESALARYQDVVVGERSLRATLYFELCAWLGLVPGALGLVLRKAFWPRMFGSCGRGVVFGAGVRVRHPGRIHLGDRVVVSEGCTLDARNEDETRTIVLGDEIILANDVMLSCKGGTIEIGPRTGIGSQTIIHSTSRCPVAIGGDVIIGPRCYIVGGGSYDPDRLDVPIWRQPSPPDRGVRLDDDIWLGANVTVLSDVTMETGSIAAAGAVITKSVPARAVCAGVPARVVKTRGEGKEGSPPKRGDEALAAR